MSQPRSSRQPKDFSPSCHLLCTPFPQHVPVAKQVSSDISLRYEGFLPPTLRRLTKGAIFVARGNFVAATQWRIKRPLPSGKCYHRSAGFVIPKEAGGHHQASPVLLDGSSAVGASWLQVLNK